MLEKWLHASNPKTGRPTLPWMHRVFIEGGATVQNFYTRGISLSVPSWSLLDTGRRLAIRGNAEYDRVTSTPYDYLNFFPFYVNYARSRRADMPAVEVLDEARIPLFIDEFEPQQRLQSMQLFQRGVRWKTLEASLRNRITSRSPKQLFNEWQIGFALSEGVGEQIEREVIQGIAGADLRYLDLFFGDYDHVAHLTNDEAAQLDVLEKLDALVGRVWLAIERSPLARETLLVLVSDHGMNTDPSIYSQSHNLIRVLNSAAGGRHHVMTNRHPMTEYKIRGLDPFVSQVITPSAESSYLQGEANEYPTALLDLDGNERAAIYLRNSDLNELHVLLKEIAKLDLSMALREAAVTRVLAVIEGHRKEWAATSLELSEELATLKLDVSQRQARLSNGGIAAKSQQWSRERAMADRLIDQSRAYGEYRVWLDRLLALKAEDLLARKWRIDQLMPKRCLGPVNTAFQLQAYVVGLGPRGLVSKDGQVDPRCFERVNYFDLLTRARVRNNVQDEVSAEPVDFIAVRTEEGILLSGSSGHQAVIETKSQGNELLLRYRPLQGEWSAGLPLRYFEDPNLKVEGNRGAWLSGWHSEREWFQAVHDARYSNGIIGLAEHFRPIEIDADNFSKRVRRMAEADILVLANDHWNFNVRSFNPGGNHGSFFRISTHSVLMFCGAGIKAGTEVTTPYDSLSFVPTLRRLLGLPVESFPGPVIQEIISAVD